MSQLKSGRYSEHFKAILDITMMQCPHPHDVEKAFKITLDSASKFLA
jgi:hypothetical protein